MPVSAVTQVLEAGFLPLFTTATAPATTAQAASMWAQAYATYVAAGGIPDALLRQGALASSLKNAFAPELGGGGPSLFFGALAAFWIGLVVPAQIGIATIFVPPSDVTSKQPDNATPADEARGLAQVISGLTLGAVQVTVTATGTIVPLL